MRKMIFLLLLFTSTALLIISAGCLHSPIAPQESPDFIEDFKEIFIAYQFDYPLFVYKDINWLNVGNEYYYLVDECDSREEFYLILEEMLAMLQDRTIRFETFDGDPLVPVPPESWVYPWQNEYTPNVDYDVLMNNYLEQYSFQPCTLGLGYCDPEQLPYLMIDRLPGDYFYEALLVVDSFISLCNDLSIPCIILDLRVQNQRNSFSDSLAGRFTGVTYSSITLRSRGGPDYWNYFDFPQTVRRAGPEQFTGTVIVLMGEQSRGATEILCAELGYNQKAILVGDQTMGSVSMYHTLNTTNNIHVTVPYQTVMMHDGTWLEAAGVPPDVYVEATQADFAAGVDPVLEYAIEQLEQY